MTSEESYRKWWDQEGSAMRPEPQEDLEEFAHRVTRIAWSNGAFTALSPSSNLQPETK